PQRRRLAVRAAALALAVGVPVDIGPFAGGGEGGEASREDLFADGGWDLAAAVEHVEPSERLFAAAAEALAEGDAEGSAGDVLVSEEALGDAFEVGELALAGVEEPAEVAQALDGVPLGAGLAGHRSKVVAGPAGVVVREGAHAPGFVESSTLGWVDHAAGGLVLALHEFDLAMGAGCDLLEDRKAGAEDA